MAAATRGQRWCRRQAGGPNDIMTSAVGLSFCGRWFRWQRRWRSARFAKRVGVCDKAVGGAEQVPAAVEWCSRTDSPRRRVGGWRGIGAAADSKGGCETMAVRAVRAGLGVDPRQV